MVQKVEIKYIVIRDVVSTVSPTLADWPRSHLQKGRLVGIKYYLVLIGTSRIVSIYFHKEE